MNEIFMWFTDLGNSKVAAIVIFFPLFIGMLLYVYTGKQRSERLESYKNIPLDDDKNDTAQKGGR